MKKQTIIIIVIGAVVILGLIAALVLSMRKTAKTETEMVEMVEMMNFEKEQLEDEYSDLAMQFDGYQINVGNDSLVQLLGQEKERVAQLLEELRTTKATNARRIAELKKELATVRTVMVQYVHQIDSLDRMNKVLVTENKAVKQRYQEVSKQAEQLQQEKAELHEVVTRASMMEITDFSMIALNNKDRKTTRYSQITKLQFNYTILKNITTAPGNKTVYLRIVRPDSEVMVKSENTLFNYENRKIPYSVSKTFEYAGEAISDILYWKVEEILQIGTYKAEFFIDGNLVGSYSFKIEK